MKNIYLTIVTLLFAITIVSCNKENAKNEQRLTPELMARLFPKPVVSPDYNADGSVTFRYKSDSAQIVQLDCQMLSERVDMVKDTNNIWSVTVTPPQPDIYPYCFIVDGKQVADPSNMYIFPNEGFKNSLADVRGTEPTMQDLQNVPHGKVSYRYYHSKHLGFDRPMCVYTPAGYNPSEAEKYPVLYLIHGMTDTYETWFKVGKINHIMDNLIAQGLAKKMIVVMPYANPYPEMTNRGMTFEPNIVGTDLFVKEMLEEVIPFVESNYNVNANAANRAIAGFSLGGRQTLATALGNPDKFQWVAAFAPALFGNEPIDNFTNNVYADAKTLNKNFKLIQLCCGNSDFLIDASRLFDKSLTDKGIKHSTHYSEGGHTWMNCRDYIELTAKQLFK